MKTCEESKKITATFDKNNPYWDGRYLYFNLTFIRNTEKLINDMLDVLPYGISITLTDIFTQLGIPVTYTSILYTYSARRHHLKIDILNEDEWWNGKADKLLLEFNTNECDYYQLKD